MAGPLEWIGQGLGMVGGAARGATRAMFPGAALNADLERDRQVLADAGGLDTEAGRQLAVEMVKKYKSRQFAPEQFTNPNEEARTNYMNAVAGRMTAEPTAGGPDMADYAKYGPGRESLLMQLEYAKKKGDTASVENLTRSIGRMDELMRGGAAPAAPGPPAAAPPTGPLAQVPTRETPQQETMAGAMTKGYGPLTGIRPAPTPTPQGLNAFYGYDDEMARQRQMQQDMAAAEAAGGVTANNVGRVVSAGTGTKRGLATAERAIASYMQSPAYAEAITKGAKPLDPKGISGPMKELLARESVAVRNELLRILQESGNEKMALDSYTRAQGGR